MATHLFEAFNAPGGPASLCQKAVNGRYPFVVGSANDIPLDDFAKLREIDRFLDVAVNPEPVALNEVPLFFR